ncbi:MAG: DUF5011 domain-containing protein [Crocinitomicaceae bacterium]|nr:DUF5011 domain-containing protein [Crocinitomicaceae bacterium]
MKKTLIFISVFGLALISCKKEGCMDPSAVNYDQDAKKEGVCNYKPTITLNGVNPDSVELGNAYTDPGATATNIDGSAVAVTIDNSALNVDSIGSYVITYTATNEHGSVSTNRTVNVYVGPGAYVGSWTCTTDCSATQFPLATDPTISAGTTSNSIVIDNFFNLIGGTANATVDGLNITVPTQTINIQFGDITFSGTGYMNAAMNQIVISYDYDNTTPVIGGAGSCTATYDI